MLKIPWKTRRKGASIATDLAFRCKVIAKTIAMRVAGFFAWIQRPALVAQCVRRFHQIPPPWRHFPPSQIKPILPKPRTDLPGRSLQMAEADITEATGTAATELPTLAFMRRAAEIVILDPVFGGASSSRSEAAAATFPRLTNGILRLAVAAVEAVKAANNTRFKAASKPVVISSLDRFSNSLS